MSIFIFIIYMSNDNFLSMSMKFRQIILSIFLYNIKFNYVNIFIYLFIYLIYISINYITIFSFIKS